MTPQPDPPAGGPPGPLARLSGWLTGADDPASTSAPASGIERVRVAAAYQEASKRLLDPLAPLQWGHEARIARDLGREAARLALLARLDLPQQQTPLGELLSLHQEPLAALLAGDSGAALQGLTSAEDPSPEELRSALERTDALLDPPLHAEQDARWRRTILRWKRGMVVLTALLLLGAAVKVSLPKRSLAAGKKWRVSSAAFACKPSEHRCGNATTSILFHTKQEKAPWFEVDLAAVKSFSEVLIHNRTDSFPERAVPLVLELSDDQKSWREVARIKEPFQTWKVAVPGGKARYLRLRVDRISTLHLEGVEVYLETSWACGPPLGRNVRGTFTAAVFEKVWSRVETRRRNVCFRERREKALLRGLEKRRPIEAAKAAFTKSNSKTHVQAPGFNPAASLFYRRFALNFPGQTSLCPEVNLYGEGRSGKREVSSLRMAGENGSHLPIDGPGDDISLPSSRDTADGVNF